MAGAPIVARVASAVVLVLVAVLPNKAIDTDALVSPLGVLTGPCVLTRVRNRALVNILHSTGSVLSKAVGCW